MEKEEFFRKLNAMDMADGNLSDVDAQAFIEVAKMVAKDKCLFLYIGPWKGKSTICLAAVASKYNGTVYALDHWQGTVGTRCETTASVMDVFSIFKTNLQLVKAWQEVVHVLYMPQGKALEILQDNLFDFILYDVDNRYPEMYWGINACITKLKHKGIIAGRNLQQDYPNVRDIVDAGIKAELDYDRNNMLHPGVIKAVHDNFKDNYKKIEGSSVWYWVQK